MTEYEKKRADLESRQADLHREVLKLENQEQRQAIKCLQNMEQECDVIREALAHSSFIGEELATKVILQQIRGNINALAIEFYKASNKCTAAMLRINNKEG